MICCSSISQLLPTRIPLFSWLYFLPLCSIFSGMHVAFVSGECLICLEDQMSLLLELKSTLKFNVAATNKLVSWNPSTDCRSWRGVTWDATGHVVDLDLSSQSISGGFNSSNSNFSLEHLQSLNLANNTFYSSQFPSGFCKLGNLTYLNLSNAGFSGQIPIEISLLTRLVTVDLSSNRLTGQIPSSLGQLRRLESLDLSLNKLSGEIPTQLTTLSSLSLLNLSFNQLVGSIPKGNPFQTFSANSFLGNSGLCGLPLKASCEDATPDIEWKYIAPELGFVTGLGIVYWPLLLCKRWRKCYNEHVDRILSRILPKQDQGRASGRRRAHEIRRRRRI